MRFDPRDPNQPKRRKFLQRKVPLNRGLKAIPRNQKRQARRAREYSAFIKGPLWRQQKERVHVRDGYQCTEHEHGQRCGYTKAHGPIHAHHERYHPRGIEYTPDKDIRTVCPGHHAKLERLKWWKAPKPY